MSFKLRKILFYFLFLAFIFVGGSVVLYSDGYRFSPTKLTLEKVGAIFVRSAPRDGSIALDGKPIKNKSWLLQSGTLIGDLLPGNYMLEVSSNRYHSWKKNVAVEPSLVTEIDYVVLVKDAPAAEIQKNVSAFWLENKLLIIKDTKNQLAVADRTLSGDEFIALSDDGTLAITRNTKTNTFYLNDSQEKSATNLSLLIKNLRARILNLVTPVTIKYAGFYPSDKQRIFIGTDKGAYLFDRQKVDLVELDENGVQLWNLNSRALFWVNAKNEAWYYDTAFGTKNEIGTSTSAVVKVDAYSSFGRLNIATLDKTGYLDLAKEDQHEKAAEKAKLFSFSPDNSKIAFVDQDGTINIEYLNKDKKVSFRLPIQGSIESFLWYKDSEHLILKYQDKNVYFIENDGLQPINYYKLGENISDYNYDSSADTLYMLEGKNLLAFEF